MRRISFVCQVPKEKAIDDVEMAINAVDFNTGDYALINVPSDKDGEVTTMLIRDAVLADNPMNERKVKMMINDITSN